MTSWRAEEGEACLAGRLSGLREACLRFGTPVAGPPGRRLDLDDPDSAIFVAEGRLDLFAVLDRDGAGRPARTFLASLGPGALLPGLEPETLRRGLGLLALADGPAELLRVPLARLESPLVDPHERAAAVEAWIATLARHAAADASPRPPIDLSLEADAQGAVLSTGDRVAAVAGTVWIEGAAGLLWCDLVPADATERPFPLHAAGFARASEPAEARLADTATVLARAGFAPVRAYGTVALEAVSARKERRAEDLLVRQRARADLDARLTRQALGDLASVDRGARRDGEADAAPADPLAGCVSAVAAGLGRPPRAGPAPEEGAPDEVRLRRLLLAHDLRGRAVKLRGRWWRAPVLPLLAWRTDGGPVALLPAGRTRFDLFAPGEGPPRRLTGKEARRIEPEAVCVHPGLPAERVRLGGLLRLGFGASWRDLAWLLAFGLLAALIGLLTPRVTGALLNTAVPFGEIRAIAELTGVLLAVAVAQALFGFLQGAALLRLQSNAEARLQPALWDRMLRLPVAFARRQASGDLAQRLVGVSEIRRILSEGLVQSILGGVFSLVNFAMIVYYGGWLALPALAIAILAVAVAGFANAARARRQRSAIAAEGRVSGLAAQCIAGLAKLRVAGADQRMLARVIGRYARYRRDLHAAGGIASAVVTLTASVPTLATLVFFVVIVFFLSGDMDPGDYVAFTVAFGTFVGALMSLLDNLTDGLVALAHKDRLAPILEAAPERPRRAAIPGPLSGRIELCDVAFRYHRDGPAVLDGVSLAVEPGEFVAIVGPSGSGKSTLLRVLLGFETPERGSVLYDGTDISALDLQALRAQFGVVLQNAPAVGGSILDNIVGQRPLTLADAWEAARRVGFDADVEAMPMKMHTRVGDGTTLSGGQRQRLMLARALAGSPRILFMDEATSALDNRTQAIVADSLARMRLTRVVIAHRLSTVMDADRIHVLDRGRIVESGTSDELRARGGLFDALVRRQTL